MVAFFRPRVKPPEPPPGPPPLKRREPDVDNISLPAEFCKAAEDHWHYALQVRTGQVFLFNELRHDDDLQWAHLDAEHGVKAFPLPLPENEFFWGRGVSVRIADIVWIADCDS